jgi:hypothetical protein
VARFRDVCTLKRPILWGFNVAGKNKSHVGFHALCLAFLSDFNQIGIFDVHFHKICSVSIFTEVCTVGAALILADRRTWRSLQALQHIWELCILTTYYFCAAFDAYKKQRLFPCTVFSDWSFWCTYTVWDTNWLFTWHFRLNGGPPRRPGVQSPGLVYVRSVLYRMTLGRSLLPPEYFGFSVSVSFHQFPILVFTLKLLFSNGQAGEVWEVSNKVLLSRISGSIGQKSTYAFV